MSYFSTTRDGLIHDLYHTENNNVPSEAVQVSDEVAKLCIEDGRFGVRTLTGDYFAPPVVVQIPQRVEMAQARLALHESGYLASVETAMAAMPKDAQIEWEFRTHVSRQSPLVSAMQSLLSLTEQQLDDLFILAASK